MSVDPELVIGAHLRAALAGEARVVGRTPRDTRTPWVTVRLLDAPDGDVAGHSAAAWVQLDCYAGAEHDTAQATVNRLAGQVRDALRNLVGAHAGAVVTGVRVDGQRRLEDTDFEPARERVILTATAWMHA